MEFRKRNETSEVFARGYTNYTSRSHAVSEIAINGCISGAVSGNVRALGPHAKLADLIWPLIKIYAKGAL